MGLFMDISPTQTHMPVLYSSQMLKRIFNFHFVVYFWDNYFFIGFYYLAGLKQSNNLCIASMNRLEMQALSLMPWL